MAKLSENPIEGGETDDKASGYVMSPEEKKLRARRSLAIAGLIVAFVVIVYLITILRIGGSIAERTF